MPHDTPLIATIAAGLGLTFVFGANAVVMGEREITRGMSDLLSSRSA